MRVSQLSQVFLSQQTSTLSVWAPASTFASYFLPSHAFPPQQARCRDAKSAVSRQAPRNMVSHEPREL